jgi:hypothetical protein
MNVRRDLTISSVMGETTSEGITLARLGSPLRHPEVSVAALCSSSGGPPTSATRLPKKDCLAPLKILIKKSLFTRFFSIYVLAVSARESTQ